MAVIFEAPRLPGGAQVLIPREVLPRTCRRLDGVPKLAYGSRVDAKRAQTKHDSVYRCPNCDHFHLATDRRRRTRTAHERSLRLAA